MWQEQRAGAESAAAGVRIARFEPRPPASRLGIDAGRWPDHRPTVRPVRRFHGTAAATLALALLVGCSGPATESGSADGGAGGGTVAQPAAPGKPGAEPAVADDDADRQVVTTATASLAVKDPLDGAQRVSELVESAGGRVDERSEQAPSGEDRIEGAAADLVVRVPAAALTGVLADLEDLGDVENVSVSRSDVTATAVDLDARISALQTSVTRLQALMDDAASTEALLAAEKALSERQGELESPAVPAGAAGRPGGAVDAQRAPGAVRRGAGRWAGRLPGRARH